MKTSTKVLIGVGAAAVLGGAVFLYMKGKKVAEPDYTTDSTAPGDHFSRFMTPPKVQAASVNTAIARGGKIPILQPNLL